MVEGADPVTRFRSVEAAEGCWMLTAPPWPTEKPCQFTTAPAVDCCIVKVDGVCAKLTEPAATEEPVGSSVAEARSTRVIAVLASSAARSCREMRGAFEIGIPA